VIARIPSFWLEHVSFFTDQFIDILATYCLQHDPQVLSVSDMLVHLADLAHYNSPKDVWLQQKDLILRSTESHGGNIIVTCLERYVSSYESIDYPWPKLVQLDRLHQTQKYTAQFYFEELPTVCIAPYLITYLFKHDMYSELFNEMYRLVHIPDSAYSNYDTLAEHAPDVEEIDDLVDESFKSIIGSALLPLCTEHPKMEQEIVLRRVEKLVNEQAQETSSSFVKNLVGFSKSKDFSNFLASQGIDISFLDVIGNDLYNSIVRGDANAGKLVKAFDRAFNRQKRANNFMVDGVIVDNADAESLVFTMTYGVLYHKEYCFSQHPNAPRFRKKTMSLYTNKVQCEKQHSKLHRYCFVVSALRYLAIFEMLPVTLITSFYYQLPQVMSILMEFDFLRPIAVRLWKAVDRNLDNKQFVDEVVATIKLPIHVFVTALLKGDLEEINREACQTYLENLLRIVKKRVVDKRISVDYAQPVVSAEFIGDNGSVFRASLVNSQEFMYLQKRDTMKCFLDGHINVLAKSAREDVSDAIQLHALKELCLLVEKFEHSLNISTTHADTLRELKSRLHLTSPSPDVTYYAARLIPYLGRFDDGIETPHEVMYGDGRNNDVLGTSSKWFLNEFVNDFARCILVYDPNIDERYYILIARCWKQIKTAFRLEEEDSPLENRSVYRHIETVVRNLLAFFNYMDEVVDEDFWRRPHFEARDYLHRDTRLNGKMESDGSLRKVPSTWVSYKDDEYTEN
jgi:hypothetical protein